ncbi:MAG TPA: preprotein translocase subunit SecY [Candidatus Azoamicus sp. OHIO1]
MSLNLSDSVGMDDLKKRLFFVVFILIIYRAGAHIPVPLIEVSRVMNAFSDESSGIFSLFNLFSGGALSKVTIFSLGIMPYISASIVMQLLSTVWEPMEKLKKEGDIGRRKISEYTRYFTVILSTFQAIAMARFMVGISVIDNMNVIYYFLIVITLVVGTMFLMWLGEQITENGIGNGISLIIFTSIVSNIPRTTVTTLEKVRQGEINVVFLLFFLILLCGVIFFVVFIERAQRKIIVNYARRQQGRKMYAAQSTYLPLKINMSGVIPPIFASSVILFPVTLIQWLDNSSTNLFLNNVKLLISPGKPLYIMVFGFSIVFFCFFYTSLIFNSNDTAENLKKSGGFISGIRPGDQTAHYISKIVAKLTTIGALYLVIVSLLPEFLILFTNIPFYFGGTSILIIVVVVMDFISQIQTKLISYQYDGLMKKSKLKGF